MVSPSVSVKLARYLKNVTSVDLQQTDLDSIRIGIFVQDIFLYVRKGSAKRSF